MKPVATICLIVSVLLTSLSWINATHKPTPLAFPQPKGWPAPSYDFKKNPLTEEGFYLGRKLFYDERLSEDSTISCASCHQQFAAFSTFEHALSHGYNNSLTTRNAPSLQNLAWEKEFMWDGRIGTLDAQPISPLTAPNEMGSNLDTINRRLRKDPEYKKLFTAAFGDPDITIERITKALSQFMLMLISADSKYDRVMRGEDSFLLPEKLGYTLFQQKCSSCHREPLFTDYSYRNTGLPIDLTLNDYGRVKATGTPKDSMAFRVPSLRNVALTYPYGHDGRFLTLLSVMEHYRKNTIQHIPLSNFEVGQLTAFLKALTDTGFVKNPNFAPPGYKIIPNFSHLH
jgi:cytochrome c peroxidase